ncbi:hypothetical protein EJO66_16755 [Variovorax beijingensis]|uniref:DUF5666 domain-containing protein n=1 Tax=Variovorax beijingensis TaxID=2496117 RepID=A0ABY0A5K7_9BURK|nr:DUF5666 domain-containing protein [Variovorax beijingensis]RSZ35635.1 hypothetical protein EJO66_16755 [Variovorax beijingensis]
MMKNHHYRWMRGILFAGAIALLLSCGGGGSGGSSAGSLGGIAGSGAAGSGSDSPAGTGTGSTGTDGTGGPSGTGTAGGGTDGTSTAGNGSDDGSGVGSGGTGVSTADATGIGSVGGLGSIILNGVRYNTDAATTSLEDTTELQIGMSVRIAGKIDSEFTAATAQRVDSAAELRGAVSVIDLSKDSFVVMGTTVTIDNATVWSGANSLAQVVAGSVVQVWGLPSAPGTLRATRVELKPISAEPLVTGMVQNLVLGQQFTLGQLTVQYSSATFSDGIDASTMAEGAIVRVRGNFEPATGVFNATKVQGWYAVPKQNAAAVQLAGVITNYTGIGDFQVLGTKIDASKTNFPSALVDSIGPGVKVEVDGFMSSGVLVAKKLRIKGGPVDFTLIGAISAYQSPSDFRVQGRPVNAGGPATVFENGTVDDLASLAPNRRISVVGDAVIDDVLIAKRVTFLPP